MRAQMGDERRVPVKTVILPDFAKALAFAVIVAHDVDAETLARPAMQLGEKLASLRLLFDLRSPAPVRQAA